MCRLCGGSAHTLRAANAEADAADADAADAARAVATRAAAINADDAAADADEPRVARDTQMVPANVELRK